MAGQIQILPPNYTPGPSSLVCRPPPEMIVEPFPLVQQPALPTLRTSLEAPRPRHASRSSGYTLRSSPLAGPAIAVSRPSTDDDTQCLEELDKNADSEKTRTGATPSRISDLYPTPPSSLRNIPVSRTPSPPHSTSEVSDQSSASSAAFSSTTPSSSIISSATASGSHTRTRSRAKIRQQLPPHRHPSTAISRPAPFEDPSSAAPFIPDTSPDATRNWLTKTAPPTFSRSRAKGVVMPVKASARRPQTAPAAPGARNLERRDASMLPQGRHGYRIEPISLNNGPYGYRNMPLVHNSRNSTSLKRKPRRPRSLMSFSLRPTLGEVREEHEREGESEVDGEGGSGEDRTAQGDEQFVKDKRVFPALAIKEGHGDASAVVQREPEKVTGWIRRWKNSLKRFKDSLRTQ